MKKCSGMTMIELVSALALMTVITVTVLALLNKATTFWSSAAHYEAQDGEVGRFLVQFENDLRQAVAESAGDPSSNLTFCVDDPKPEANEDKRNFFLCFVRPSATHGQTAETEADGGETWRLSLDCVKYALNAASGEIVREVHPLYSDKAIGEQVKQIWQSETPPTGETASKVVLKDALVTLFGATALDYTLPFETNALPAGVAIHLRAFKDATERGAYRELLHETSEDKVMRRETLGVPYSLLISFPTHGGETIL